MITISPFEVAKRFIGLKEIDGPLSNYHILVMLQLDNSWVQDDSTAWCSAFCAYVAWLLNLPRSKSLAARSWLKVGTPIELDDAKVDADVVILKRGGGPGPDVIAAPGHVGFFAGRREDGAILLLGGNQGNSVSIAPFVVNQLLGVRRLA